MSKTKKLTIGVFVAALAGAAYFGYSAPSEDAKMVGESPTECEKTCPSSACFCNRQCIIVWCWGPYYCQCHD